MKELDVKLDNSPTEGDVIEMARLRERNLLSFKELQSYNDSDNWNYKHPLIVHMSERFILEELRRRNPEQFLKEYSNCANNVRRYKSFLKNKSRAGSRKRDRENLKKHRERLAIFESILSDET